MIRILIRREDGHAKGIETKGHALFSSYGTDIVCASASVLVINTLNSLEALSREDMKVKTDKDKGVIRADFPKGLSKEGELLLSSMELGLRQIEKEYGKEYLYLSTEEVRK